MPRLPSDNGTTWYQQLRNQDLVAAIGDLHLARAFAFATGDADLYRRASSGVLPAQQQLVIRVTEGTPYADPTSLSTAERTDMLDDPQEVALIQSFGEWQSHVQQLLVNRIGGPLRDANGSWLKAASALLGSFAADRALGAPKRDEQRLMLRMAAMDLPFNTAHRAPLKDLAERDRVRLQFHSALLGEAYWAAVGVITDEQAASRLVSPAREIPNHWPRAYLSTEGKRGWAHMSELQWGGAELLRSGANFDDIFNLPIETLATKCRADGASALLAAYRPFLDMEADLNPRAAERLLAILDEAAFKPAAETAMWMSDLDRSESAFSL